VAEAMAVVREGVTRTIRAALSHRLEAVIRTIRAVLSRRTENAIPAIRPALSRPTTAAIRTIRHATIPTQARTRAAATAGTMGRRPQAEPTLVMVLTLAGTSLPWRAQRLACAASVPTATLAVGMGASGAPGLSAPCL